MKKIFPILFSLFLFFFIVPTLNTNLNAAGTCTCSMDSSRTLYVSTKNCSTNSVATCSSTGTSLANMTISCNCVESQPGVNCVTSGVPPAGQTCCTGYQPEPRSGACIPVGTSPNLPHQVPASTECGIYGNVCCSNGECNSSNLICSSKWSPPRCWTQDIIDRATGYDSVTCTPTGGTVDSGISTAIGCIPILGPTGQTDFLSFILKWAVGIGGGIAFLLILYAGFMIMTSAGNPDRLKAGQELLTSAISGLILLVFSIFILKFIGVDILGLCKFGFGTC